MRIEEWMNLPKVELHCHLDGSLPKSFVEEILDREVREEELQVSQDCTSLAQYLEKFDLPIQCLTSQEALKKSGESFLMELKKENLVYVEVRFAPLHHINDNLNTSQVVEAVLEGMKEGEKKTGIRWNLIICCMRHHSYEENLKMLEDCLPYLGKGICAADLAGGEAAFPMKQFMGLFDKAREMGYPLTIHAGECGYAPNILDSLEVGAKRIGHGIAMTGHEEIKNLCKENGIAIEMCPISNQQTKAVEDMDNYPIREFLDQGLKVTINTDNRTVSNTALWKEYEFIQKRYGVTDLEIKNMIKNALEASFADEKTKEEIRARLG